MKTLYEKEINGEFNLDIGISVEEWEKILQDEELTTFNYKDTLLKFFHEPVYKSTCKFISEKYGETPYAINSKIMNFGKAVQRKLNRFQVVGVDGKPTYWIIPMTGKRLHGGLFEWTLREELVQAMKNLGEDWLSVKITNFENLINSINRDLGNDFINQFREKRKELAHLGRLPKSGILFKYENTERDWAINEGAGTEIQFHIYYNGNRIGYGLGLNTRYVRFKDDLEPIEYVRPFAEAFYKLSDTELVKDLVLKGFHFENNDFNFLLNLEENTHYLFGKNIELKEYKISFEDYSQMLENIKGELFQLYSSIFELRNEMMNNQTNQMQNVQQYINLLEESKNLIFTGAPGTGKSYLAKEIAKQMIGIQKDEELKNSDQFCFVQFHPSYDYTDFVEGLRPTKPDENGNIGFELKDGVFKSFCKNAMKMSSDNFDKSWDKLIEKVEENLANEKLTLIGRREYSLSSVNSLKYTSNSPSEYKHTITRQNVYDVYQNKKARPSGTSQNYMEEVVAFMKEHFGLNEYVEDDKSLDHKKKYIFLIDEINRGEISKIFGELFFSIDPSYRGEKGAVKTQYFNLHEDENEMFYIPENVYIIGTMNDIDRSVESFDFAMRRRFVWQEITAAESANNMNLSDEVKFKMNALNKAIEDIEGLNASYHIGGAYFLDKDGNSRTDYENLWNRRIEPLLKEYLRGMPDSGENLESLQSAFNSAYQSEDNGQ